jgi:hypothetical protein
VILTLSAEENTLGEKAQNAFSIGDNSHYGVTGADALIVG